MAALVTTAEIKNYLTINSDTEDANLATMANYVSTAIESYCGRVFTSNQVTEIHDGGRNSIFVKRPPINNVSQVWEYDGSQYVKLVGPTISTGELPNTKANANAVVAWIFSPVEGVIFKEDLFPKTLEFTRPDAFKPYKKGVKIVYNGGYDTIPNDLKLAALDYVKILYKQEQGVAAITFQGESKNPFPQTTNFPPHIKRILDFYRLLP